MWHYVPSCSHRTGRVRARGTAVLPLRTLLAGGAHASRCFDCFVYVRALFFEFIYYSAMSHRSKRLLDIVLQQDKNSQQKKRNTIPEDKQKCELYDVEPGK